MNIGEVRMPYDLQQERIVGKLGVIEVDFGFQWIIVFLDTEVWVFGVFSTIVVVSNF